MTETDHTTEETYRGKLAVVTGITRGIGKVIAEYLVARGAKVLGTGTRPDGGELLECDYRAVDFSNLPSLLEFAKELEILKPDILINNAGINKIATFTEIDLKDFQLIQQVNLLSPFLLCRAVVPGMKSKKWGRIVNISSIFGLISKEKRASYSASKFALDGITKALAAEVASYGVLANCVSPGFIDTELTRTVLSKTELSDLTTQIPAKRLGSAEEIAEFVVWLAGPKNTYISGQNIPIDGGFSKI
jgi:NAD(P)-dependent dehydrogenase (short-subunit alcohol dehydrogenase family)